MDPWPAMDIPTWPEKTGNVYILTEEFAAKFSLVLGTLISYISTQQARCLKEELTEGQLDMLENLLNEVWATKNE